MNKNGYKEKSFGEKLGRAVFAAGDTALATLATAAFGGGDQGGTSEYVPDLTIIGPQPDGSAIELDRTPQPKGCSGLFQLWALTPNRLGVLLPVRTPKAPKPGLNDLGRSLIGTAPEEFGPNVPAEPVRAPEIRPWFAIDVADVVDFNLVGPGKDSSEWRHCALQLADGSGFVLNGKTPADARHMVEAMRRGWGRG